MPTYRKPVWNSWPWPPELLLFFLLFFSAARIQAPTAPLLPSASPSIASASFDSMAVDMGGGWMKALDRGVPTCSRPAVGKTTQTWYN